MENEINISIILPCLNEESAIIHCLSRIQETIKKNLLIAEVIVVDNNSNDASADLVASYQKNFPELILSKETKTGYGFAYLKGLSIARGRYIFMADADGTYDFADIPLFLKKLAAGSDLVIGNRFSGKMAVNSMPWLHRYLGNPCLSWLVRLLFKVKINDIHCGARAISSKALKQLNLRTGGMEFASEMIIKAAKTNLKITEVSINYQERLGESKLRSWTDGWRHLRFILIYSPLIVFIIPGLAILTAGIFLTAALYSGGLEFFGVPLYSYPIFLFSALIILGYQLIIFGGFSKVYTVTHLGDTSPIIQRLFRYLTIAKTSLIGLLGALISFAFFAIILKNWISSGFGSINDIKNFVIAYTILILGMQTFFSAFIFSILGIKEK